LGGQGEGSPVKAVRWGDVGVLGRSSAEAEEDPGEMSVPGGVSGACTQRILESAVEAFHEAVGLRMVGCGGAVGDVEGVAEVRPEGRGELRATIRSDDGRDAETSNPVVDEGVCAVGGGGRGERYRVWPASGAVDDGEKVCVTRGMRKGTDQVNVNVRKLLGRDRNDLGRNGGVLVNFGALAGEAGAAPSGNIAGKVRPDIAGRKEAACGADSRVGQAVNEVKQGLP